MKNILIVDDEQEALENYFYDFKNIDASLYFSTNAHEALELIKDTNFSCIISDFNLPSMNGKDFIDKIRKTNEHVPILVITGFGDGKKHESLKKYNITDFLTKPYDKDSLEFLVSDLLEDEVA